MPAETNRAATNNMSLDHKDLELIERIIYKNSDDIAASICRSFERLEARIDAAEARTYSRISDLEDKIEALRQDVVDEMGEVKGEIRDYIRHKEAMDFA